MAGKRTIIGDIVREYCLKYPDLPDLTVARLIAKNEPKLITNVGNLRDNIRYHRKKRQVKNAKTGRKYCAKDAVAHNTGIGDTRSWRYRAPASHKDDYSDFIIHGSQRILRLSDIHYPFHDERALEAAINHGIKFDPTILLLAGDIMDCHDLSDYDRDPRHRYTEVELEMMSGEIRQFRKAFSKARIVWMEGNHENRLQRYLLRKAPDLFGLPMLDIPGLLTMAGGADTMTGIEWINDSRIVRTGNLAHIHGHEYRGGGGVNPARWLFLKTGENTMMGHCHRTSEHSEPNQSRKQIGCWSTGCLSDLSPKYMRHTKWNHGLATIEVDRTGDFEVSNHRIINGKVR